MATTVAIKVLPHQKKLDGTFNVKIRLIHYGKTAYISTLYFVDESQMTSKFEVIDPAILQLLNETVKGYRHSIQELGGIIRFLPVRELAHQLKDGDKELDFIKFCKEYIDGLISEGKTSSASTLKTVMYSLVDYFGRGSISPLEITENELCKYEKYLRNCRTLKRINKGKFITREVPGMADAGVHNHFRDLRLLFKAAMRRFNNPQRKDIKIPYCPFDRYKIVDAPETKKRNLKIEQIILIKNLRAKHGCMEMARDLFLLSFYLCGMNAVDIYHLRKSNIINNRIEYNREKTKGRRKDRAFISIRITKESRELLFQYIETLHCKYSTSHNFTATLNKGLKQLCNKIGMPHFTFYWARHSFGTIARNKCRLSKDDVALALNHIDTTNKTTDIYLEKDWDIVDDVQRAVLRYLSTAEREINKPAIQKMSGVRLVFQSIALPVICTTQRGHSTKIIQ